MKIEAVLNYFVNSEYGIEKRTDEYLAIYGEQIKIMHFLSPHYSLKAAASDRAVKSSTAS